MFSVRGVSMRATSAGLSREMEGPANVCAFGKGASVMDWVYAPVRVMDAPCTPRASARAGAATAMAATDAATATQAPVTLRRATHGRHMGAR